MVMHTQSIPPPFRLSKQSELTRCVIEPLRKIYDEITVHEGYEHDYLGMIVPHNRENNSVRINMEKYIEGVIDVFLMDEPDEPVKIVATPATNNLFKVRKLEK